MYKSIDGGNTFFETSAGLPVVSQRVYSLGIHPTNPDILYAGTYYNGIYRSTDGGATWSQVSTAAWFLSSITTTPTNPEIVYAGADTAIYKSTDAGLSWFNIGAGYSGARKNFRNIIAHPLNDSIVYTTDYFGFYRSFDGAVSWTASNYSINTTAISCFAISRSVPSIIYIYAEGYGVFKTTNSGVTWTRLSSPFACRLGALGVHIINPDIVYTGGIPDLYKTVDGGSIWYTSSMGLNGYVNDIEIDPQNTDIIFAGTPNGIYKTTDGAVIWQDKGLSEVSAIVINPFATDSVYAGTAAGVFKSRDQGNTWYSMGLEDESITEMKIDPDNYLFAGTDGAGMFRWNLIVSIAENPKDKPVQPWIYAAPNPALQSIKIHYQLIKTGVVCLNIYDIQGRLIKELVNEKQSPGVYTVSWNGVDGQNIPVSSGVYFYRLSASRISTVKKIILLK